MELRNRWLIARQDSETHWEFFADRGVWTKDLHRAVHFLTLWGAEEAQIHSAGGQGVVRNAADVYEFALQATKVTEAPGTAS